MTIFGVAITVIDSLEDLENVELQSIEYWSMIWRTEVDRRGFSCHHAFLTVKVLGWSIGIWLLHVKGGLIACSSLHCFGHLHRMYSNGRYDTFLNMHKPRPSFLAQTCINVLPAIGISSYLFLFALKS